MIAGLFRWTVYGLCLVMVGAAASTAVLGQIYDTTQMCQRGSVVALSGCHEGHEPIAEDPLGEWDLSWMGKGPPKIAAYEPPAAP